MGLVQRDLLVFQLLKQVSYLVNIQHMHFVTTMVVQQNIRISNHFPAISEGRGMARGEIGIAAIDLKHPHLVLCQFSDTLLYTHTLTKINYFNPIEVCQ